LRISVGRISQLEKSQEHLQRSYADETRISAITTYCNEARNDAMRKYLVGRSLRHGPLTKRDKWAEGRCYTSFQPFRVDAAFLCQLIEALPSFDEHLLLLGLLRDHAAGPPDNPDIFMER